MVQRHYLFFLKKGGFNDTTVSLVKARRAPPKVYNVDGDQKTGASWF
jgi:hypothetical protein